MNQTAAIGATMMLIVGCNSATMTNFDPATPGVQSVESKEVMFYIAGMNERLKIL